MHVPTLTPTHQTRTNVMEDYVEMTVIEQRNLGHPKRFQNADPTPTELGTDEGSDDDIRHESSENTSIPESSTQHQGSQYGEYLKILGTAGRIYSILLHMSIENCNERQIFASSRASVREIENLALHHLQKNPPNLSWGSFDERHYFQAFVKGFLLDDQFFDLDENHTDDVTSPFEYSLARSNFITVRVVVETTTEKEVQE